MLKMLKIPDDSWARCGLWELTGGCGIYECPLYHDPEITPELISAREQNPYFRTKPCKYYEKGLCKNGDECHYIHTRPSPKEDHELYRTKPCRYFRAGSCKNGDECHYIHEGVKVLRCFNCNEIGHHQKECENACRKCHAFGHMASKCTQCHQCKQWGHHKNDCPEGCHMCGDYEHTARNCTRIVRRKK